MAWQLCLEGGKAMIDKEAEILGRKAKADAVLENTAQELRAILHRAVKDLDPFPNFFDSPFIHAVEAERGAATQGQDALHRSPGMTVGPAGAVLEDMEVSAPS